jgi:hypothetical protein
MLFSAEGETNEKILSGCTVWKGNGKESTLIQWMVRMQFLKKKKK